MNHGHNIIRAFYKKLLSLYPRAFREHLGESMEQTFNDLYHEKQEAKQVLLSFVLWVFFETSTGIARENILRIKQGEFMKNFLTNPASASVFSFILILPLLILFPIAVLEIEPFYGIIKSAFVEADGYTTIFGKIVMIVAILLLPVAAAFVSFMPIIRNVRAGNGIMAHPINLFLATVIASFIILFIGGFIIDQYPCWMGVPNCD
jgi:hypothetical protein